MGISMIGMKSFLICEKDRDTTANMITNAGIDGLAQYIEYNSV